MAGQRGTAFLLLGMLLWIAAGLVGAILIAGCLALGSALLRGGLGFSGVPEPSQLVYVLVATSGFQGTLLLGALWQGRRNGIGIQAIRHRRPVVLCCVAMVGWLTVFVVLAGVIPALREFAKSVTPDALSSLSGGGPAVAVLRVALILILAPVSEELFFRGWLWEAMRRRGQTIMVTATLTATPWLLLHGIDSPGRILFLLPAAVIFSIARYRGGSVLASLAVHLTNNGTAVLMQVVSELLGHK